jgi:hypothetical protein
VAGFITVYWNDTWFIYTLADPRTGIVMYVGLTRNPDKREYQNRCCSKKLPVGKWMDELSEAGVEPVFTVLEKIKGDQKARRKERELIAFHRKQNGGVLLNRKAGKPGRFNTARQVELARS